MSVRILHISDIHYGRNGQLDWIDRAMTHAVDTGIDAGCELAVISGDSFDHALSTHEPAFTAFVRQVVWLAENMSVVVLQGTHSHDRPGALDVLKAIPAPNSIIVADKIGSYAVASCDVHVLPSLNKGDPEIMAEGAHAWTARKLAEFSAWKSVSGARVAPKILVTHGTVTGCTTESGYAMVSPDLEFSVENLAAADCDAVLVGHIHRHQSWPNVRTPSGSLTTIAYPGSLARLVHGHREPVGFLIWTLEPGKPATFQFHASPSRQLLEVDFPGLPDMDELRAIAAQAGPDDSVRVRWTVDEEHAASVDKALIRDLFAGAESLKIEPRVMPVTRVRAEGIGKAVTLYDKLRHWAETTNSREAYGRLADRLMLLQGMDVEQIVQRITTTEATKP